MNAAVRAVTRMGIYVGAKVYLIHEVKIFIEHNEYFSKTPTVVFNIFTS